MSVMTSHTKKKNGKEVNDYNHLQVLKNKQKKVDGLVFTSAARYMLKISSVDGGHWSQEQIIFVSPTRVIVSVQCANQENAGIAFIIYLSLYLVLMMYV